MLKRRILLFLFTRRINPLSGTYVSYLCAIIYKATFLYVHVKQISAKEAPLEFAMEEMLMTSLRRIKW